MLYKHTTIPRVWKPTRVSFNTRPLDTSNEFLRSIRRIVSTAHLPPLKFTRLFRIFGILQLCVYKATLYKNTYIFNVFARGHIGGCKLRYLSSECRFDGEAFLTRHRRHPSSSIALFLYWIYRNSKIFILRLRFEIMQAYVRVGRLQHTHARSAGPGSNVKVVSVEMCRQKSTIRRVIHITSFLLSEPFITEPLEIWVGPHARFARIDARPALSSRRLNFLRVQRAFFIRLIYSYFNLFIRICLIWSFQLRTAYLVNVFGWITIPNSALN